MSPLFQDEERISVAILGSTGSVGRQALDVIRQHSERFEVVALAAGSDVEGLLAQAKEFDVRLLSIAEGDFPQLDDVRMFSGPDSAEKIVEETEAEVVLNAVVGAAGLKATMATIMSGKNLALANKESLVAAGEAVMAKASPGQLRPVDSEHSALWQILDGQQSDRVRRVVVTGSGGPFRGKDPKHLAGVSVQDALAHPVWDMGPKISIDSATLMNKGLEVIEAHFLFGFTYDEIEVAIHPQGFIHGMVEMSDGSLLMHAAQPDMRLPIQIALAWPNRLGAPGDLRVERSNLEWTFEPPDRSTFRCLDLAYEAGRRGDTYPAVLNAANEIAVRSFMDERISFLDIPTVVEKVLELHEPTEPRIEEVLEQDAWARARATRVIAEL